MKGNAFKYVVPFLVQNTVTQKWHNCGLIKECPNLSFTGPNQVTIFDF